MSHTTISFELNGMLFEYDEDKNLSNIKKHGISFRNAARVFFDYDRIELYDDEIEEDRYDTIGDTSAGNVIGNRHGEPYTMIGDISRFSTEINDVVYVVYTERFIEDEGGKKKDVTRIISARLATSFERGLYYGKCD